MAQPLNKWFSQNSEIRSIYLNVFPNEKNYSEAPVLTTLTPAVAGDPVIFYGQLVMWDNATKLLKPFTATYATGTWTPAGTFAGFSMQDIAEGTAYAEFAFAGILDLSQLRFDLVSQTAGQTYTSTDLAGLPNVEIQPLNNYMYASGALKVTAIGGAPDPIAFLKSAPKAAKGDK